MLAEQQSLRFSPRFSFEMNPTMAGNPAAANMSLEEKAMWAARSQIILRAAAAAAVGPYAGLVSPLVYPGAPSTPHTAAAAAHHQQQQQQQQQALWWSSLGASSLFAAAHHQQQQQLAASSSQQSSPPAPAAPRALYPSTLALAHHRYLPYGGKPKSSQSTPTSLPPLASPSRRATPSPSESYCREAQDLSPS